MKRKKYQQQHLPIKVLVLLLLTEVLACIVVTRADHREMQVAKYIEPVAISEPAQIKAPVTENPIESEEPVPPYTEADIDMLARMVWGEARGCVPSEQSLCVWTIINRLEDGGFGDSIEAIVTAPYQFVAYHESNPVKDDIRAVVVEALEAWAEGEDAPVLEPYAATSRYLYFSGNSEHTHNYFREVY